MARLNLARIETEVKNNVHNSSLSDVQIDRWVDMAQDRILRTVECDFLLDSQAFSTVAAQRTYYIESAFNKILDILNISTDRELAEMPERGIRAIDPALSDTGTPDAYSLTGYAEVKAQFATASTITVFSSSGADVTVTVRLRGRVNGIESTEAITLAGVAPVAGTLTFDAAQDLSVRLSTGAVGKVTVTDTGSATTLVVIPAGMLRRPYNKIALYPIPSAAESLVALVYRNPYYLSNDEDIPDLPEGWEDLVLRGVMIEAHRYMYEFDVADKLEGYVERDLLKLKKEQGNSRNSNRRLKGTSKFTMRRFGKMPTTFTGGF